MSRDIAALPKGGAQPVLPKRLKAAITDLVHSGDPGAEVAKRHGYHPRSWSRALQKPNAIAFRRALVSGLLAAEGERSLAVLVALRDSSASDHVRLEAVKHLLALAGIRPPEQRQVEADRPAGYVLVLGAPQGEQGAQHLVPGPVEDADFEVIDDRDDVND